MTQGGKKPGEGMGLTKEEKGQLLGIPGKVEELKGEIGEMRAEVDGIKGELENVSVMVRSVIEQKATVSFEEEAENHGFSIIQWAWINQMLQWLGVTGYRDEWLEEVTPLGQTGLRIKKNLDLHDCLGITSLPDPLEVEQNLNLVGCFELRDFPRQLRVGGTIYCKGCKKEVIERAYSLMKEKKVKNVDTETEPDL